MLRQISDYLFMGSLILLVLTFVIYGFGIRGMVNSNSSRIPSGSITDIQLEHDHNKTVDFQNRVLVRILKSYLFWISVAGILTSIVISKI